MNMLAAMLWAWVGVCGVSVLAAAVIVVAQARVDARELANGQATGGHCVVGQGVAAGESKP